MKKILKKILTFFIPLRKSIVFESRPDFSDNSMAVFKEMIRMKLNLKYKLIWIRYEDTVFFINEKNVKIIDSKRKILVKYYLFSSKVLICCNRFFGSSRKNQKSFYISHGSPLKDARSYYNLPNTIDYLINAGDKMNILTARALKFDINKSFSLGYPRNDVLYKKNCDLNLLFGQYDKFIIWYPTVRQFNTGLKTQCKNAIPLIENQNDAIMINEFAKKHNILIIIKPHFAQDITYIKYLNLSNIVFIDDNWIKEKNITSYELLSASDGLLTDYSSVYYDYMICNKPIGLIWVDLDLYKANPGLIPEYEYFSSGGEKIYSVDELLCFLKRIKDGIDELMDVRNKINNEVNYISNDSASSRVVNFIIDKADLRR